MGREEGGERAANSKMMKSKAGRRHLPTGHSLEPKDVAKYQPEDNHLERAGAGRAAEVGRGSVKEG